MQLKYDDEFDAIISDINNYKPVEKLCIDDFIKKIIDNIYLFDFENDNYICSKCLNELINGKCDKCDKTYDINNDTYNILYFDQDEVVCFYIYKFDVQDSVLLLYHVWVTYNLKSKTYETNIENLYEVNNLGLYDLITEKFNSFENYKQNNNDYEKTYLYKDNLDILKDNYYYKYTSIWELKNIDNCEITLESITLYPLYYKQYEYLMKMGLYNLALSSTPRYSHKKFKDNFGVDKKYYEFMKNININNDELEILKIVKEPNKELIDYYKNYVYITQELSKYVKLSKLKKYLEKQKLSDEYIIEYRDYINYLEKLSMDLKDKNNLFPKNLLDIHDKLELQIKITENKDLEDKIKSLSNILKINSFTYEDYIIFPAGGIKDLIDESRQMHNCVRTYISNVSENKCQIYFMRHKENINESFVTIEVKNNHIVQARCKYNKLPNNEINNILKKWEKTLIPIYNEEE